MADLEVTLGAKNEASEVLRQFQQDFQNAGQNIQFSLRGLGQLAGLTAVVVGVVEGAKAIANFATSSVTAFDDVNKSAVRLNETLEILPNTAGVSGDQLTKLAEQLERVTNVDQSQILNQMTAAARRGADPGQLDEMAEAAIGLSRVFDRDLGSAMRLVEQATQGNFEAFRGLIPQIDALATEEEKLAAVSKLAQTGLENKAQAARSALESSEALHVAMKQLYQTVGALIVPLRDVVYKGFVLISDFIVGTINPDLETFEDLIKRITDTVNGLAEMMLTGFISAFTAAETAIMNFSQSVGIAVDFISLRVLTMVEDVKYGFSTLASQIGALTGQVHRFAFIGMMNALTVLAPLTEESQAVVDAARENIAKALAVPPRQITEAENALKDSINTRLDSLFDQYNQKFQERMQSLTREVKIPFKVELERSKRPKEELKLQPEIFRDLQAFESRILTRGPAQSPVDRIAENSEKTAKNTEEMLRAQSETNRILGFNVSPGDAKLVEIR